MQPDDMFVLDVKGDVVHTPAAKPPPNRPPKLSECSPLFMAVSSRRLSPSSPFILICQILQMIRKIHLYKATRETIKRQKDPVIGQQPHSNKEPFDEHGLYFHLDPSFT
jgi:hypothetical protein